MRVITFKTAVNRVLEHEGGYVNHPDDPGQETNFGISKRSYPHVDIKNLTRQQAEDIYFRDFWCPVAKGLHGALMFQVFDAAVNHGIGNAVRMLQRAVGVVDDGHWGPVSRAAYKEMSQEDSVIRFLAERLDFVRRLSRFDTFGRGWVKRIVDNLRHYSQDNDT
jgi:lysozyme family protein